MGCRWQCHSREAVCSLQSSHRINIYPNAEYGVVDLMFSHWVLIFPCCSVHPSRDGNLYFEPLNIGNKKCSFWNSKDSYLKVFLESQKLLKNIYFFWMLELLKNILLLSKIKIQLYFPLLFSPNPSIYLTLITPLQIYGIIFLLLHICISLYIYV